MGRRSDKERKTKSLATTAVASGGIGPADAGNRERWVLTRKTWKYMTDAGRRLIPEGTNPNRTEDIPKIEEYFQEVCRNEKKFVLWRRKSSFPESAAESRTRKRNSCGGSKRFSTFRRSIKGTAGNRRSTAKGDGTNIAHGYKDDDCIESSEENSSECSENLETMKLLANFLHINDNLKLFAPSTDHDQLSGESGGVASGYGFNKSIAKSTHSFRASIENLNKKFLQNFRPNHHSSVNNNNDGGPTTSTSLQQEAEHTAKLNELVDSLRSYMARSKNLSLMGGGGGHHESYDRITKDTLKDQRLLKKIYNEIKQRELTRILRQRSSVNLPLSQSMSNLFPYSNRSLYPNAKSSSQRVPDGMNQKQIIMGQSCGTIIAGNQLVARTANVPQIEIKQPSLEKNVCHFGTQTLPVHVDDIRKMNDEYKKMMNQMASGDDDKQAEDEFSDESNQLPSPPSGSFTSSTNNNASATNLNRRKSSIDNEDVSESVSNTIKRYLRMARKKSTNDTTQANRFKRINYDRTLRNIKPKSLNISILAIDDDLTKGSQTDDDWTETVLGSLKNQNTSKQFVFDENSISQQQEHSPSTVQAETIRQQQTGTTSPTLSSPPSSPPSPTSSIGFLQTGTNFISSLLRHNSSNFLYT